MNTAKIANHVEVAIETACWPVDALHDYARKSASLTSSTAADGTSDTAAIRAVDCLVPRS